MSLESEASAGARPAVLSSAVALAIHIRKTAPVALISGLGGALAIWFLATMTQSLEQALLIAPSAQAAFCCSR